MKRSQSSIQDRMGLLQVRHCLLCMPWLSGQVNSCLLQDVQRSSGAPCPAVQVSAVGTAMTSLIKTLNVFPRCVDGWGARQHGMVGRQIVVGRMLKKACEACCPLSRPSSLPPVHRSEKTLVNRERARAG